MLVRTLGEHHSVADTNVTTAAARASPLFSRLVTEETPMPKATILIVEDNDILARHIEVMLSGQGYTLVGPLATGEEVVGFLADQQVDLILIDIELAGAMNGIATAEAVKQLSDIPVVFLTDFSHNPLLEQAKIFGPYGYLIKPVAEQELAATVKMALHRHSLHRQLQDSRLALAKSEAKYRDLFENSPLGIFRTTLDGKALAVNTEMARMVGCASPEEAIANFTRLADQLYVNPERRQQFVTLLKSEGAVKHFEYAGRKKNGETLWISMNAKLTRTDSVNSKTEEVVIDGFALDITDRKRAEQTLRDGERLLRDIAANIPGALYQFVRHPNGSFSIPFMSEGASQVFGQPLEVLQDASRLFENVHPDDIQRLWSSISLSAETMSKWRQEFRIVFPSGQLRWLQGNSQPSHLDDGGICWNGVVLDITEQKQAEQSYQTLFHEMLNGFALHEIIYDSAGYPVDYRFLAVNPAFERMTGLKSTDVVGRSVKEVMPGIESHWIESYGRVVITGEPAFFENSSGDLKKYFEVTAYRPVPHQFACIFADITERKKAEDERKSLQHQLQQAQKMEAIGTLAGGIAHDFNNILGAVIGYAELAREDSPPGSTAALDLDQVIKASHRAKDLVKQILAFSRQAENKQIPIQPAVIIKETLKMLRASLPSTIVIDQNLVPDAGSILADPTQIHQIIMNLCTNAFHAMEESGGILSIGMKRCALDLDALVGAPHVKAGDFIHIAIGDTGQGIAPAIRDKIFDPFFTTKEVGKGTGMGLSIVHGIVKSYGGFVRCESKLGKGTVFHIYLPLLSVGHPLPETATVENIPVGNEHILYIDDESMLVEMGQNMLQRLGYQVTVCNSSLEALASFQNQPEAYDLVITDQTMPGMTGIDLARRMLQIRPNLPIILCTGYSNLITEDRAKAAGIKGFAFKPLAKNDLAMLIHRVLGKSTNGRNQAGGKFTSRQ
jgi:PAS domain S-box-containing protein